MTESLTEAEIRDVERYLSSPLHFPAPFKSWITDYFAGNIPQIPVGQLLGARGLPRILDVNTEVVSLGSFTTPAQEFYSYTLPGGLLGKNGTLRVRCAFDAECEDSFNIGSPVLYVNGVETGLSIFNLLHTEWMDGTLRPGSLLVIVQNLGSFDSQALSMVGHFDGAPGSSLQVVTKGDCELAAYDTTQDLTLQLRLVWEDGGGQSFNKRYASTEIFNPIGF